MRYIIAPLEMTTEEFEIYRLLYIKMNFDTMEVKYTVEQLAIDSNQKLMITKKKASLIVKEFIEKGYLSVIRKGSKGNPTIYKVIKIVQIEKHKSNLTETQKELKGNLKETNNVSDTNSLEDFEKHKGNAKETQKELKGNTKGNPINDKDNDKEKENNNNKKNELEIEIESYTTNQDLRETFIDFLKMRKSIKKPMTLKALKLLMNKLNKMSKNDYHKIQILEQSIMYSWQGVFDLKEDIYGKPKQDNKPSSSEEYNFDKYTG